MAKTKRSKKSKNQDSEFIPGLFLCAKEFSLKLLPSKI